MPLSRYELFSVGQVDATVIMLQDFRMNSLMRKINQKRFVVPPLYEFNGISSEKIGNVPVGLHIFAIIIDLRIKVRPLSFKTNPPIKTGAPGVVVPHVPLAYESRCVTRLAQQKRERGELMTCRGTVDVISDPVSVWILASQKTSARRRAKRIGNECISKKCAFVANAIDVGRLDEWVIGHADIIPPQVIDENKNNIRWSLLLAIGLRRTH